MRWTKKFVPLILAFSLPGCGSTGKLSELYDRLMTKHKGGKPDAEVKEDTIKNLDGRRTFTNCDEINTYLRIMAKRETRRPVSAEVVSTAPTPHQLADLSPRREALPFEVSAAKSDIVVDNESSLFVLRPMDVVVIDKATKTEVGRLALPAGFGVGGLSPKLFLRETNLILVTGMSGYTLVEIYDLHHGGLPTRVSSTRFEGRVQDVHLEDERLRLISSQQLPDQLPAGAQTVSDVACSNIIVPLEQAPVSGGEFLPNAFRTLTMIHSMDPANPNLRPPGLGVLDLIRAAHEVGRDLLLISDAPPSATFPDRSTLLRLIGTDHGPLALMASGVIAGVVKDSSALYSYVDHTLAVATTSYSYSWPDGRSHITNHFFTISTHGQDLVPRESPLGFGGDQYISAIRYLGNNAYIATSNEATSPGGHLFTFDISRHQQPPQSLGNLALSGSLSMLYPVGDGRLLGLGHEVVGGSHIDSGLRLSHFDVSNLANPVQLDSLHSEGHMESLYDQNALYYDPTESRIGLPWFGPLAPVPADSVVSEGPSRGANFYVITPGEMTFEKHISHQQFIPTECWGVESHFGRSDTGFDIQRIINVNKEIYAVSPFGLTVYGRDLSQPKSTLIFQDGTRACAQMISAYMPRCGTNELPPAPPIRE